MQNENMPPSIAFIGFDIETTGLHPLDSEVVSWAADEIGYIQDNEHSEVWVLEQMIDYFSSLNKYSTTILTFNGGTLYNPGFDFRFIRTRMLIHKLEWPFKNFMHVDLYPIIQKWFDTTYSEPVEFDSMSLDMLKSIAKANGVKPGTSKSVTKNRILEVMSESDIKLYISDNNITHESTHNGLKDCCMNFFGIKDDGIKGELVPDLFDKWKQTGDQKILDDILSYNKDDCVKTKQLFNAIRPMLSNRIISGEQM